MMNKFTARFKRDKQPKKPGVITNDNIDEHREKVLKDGKKFKYPLQYAKHKVLINSIIIAMAALAAFTGVVAFMLYYQQDRSDFFYTVTRVIPLPVAKVGDDDVRYSDYLLRLRSSIHYIGAGGSEVDINTPEGAGLIAHTKYQELIEAEKDVLAVRLARELDVTVSNDEVDGMIDSARQAGTTELSQESFEQAVLRDLYGQSLDEFRIVVRYSLLRSKIVKAVDADAKTKVESVLSKVLANPDQFNTLAKDLSEDEVTKANDGKVVEVSLDSQIVDSNGIIAAAKKLEEKQISGIISGVDGYYVIRLDAKSDSTISYSVIKIGFHEFERRFDELKASGQIHEYITVKSE